MIDIQPKDRTNVIDRASPIPIYHQIASDIINRISMGEWQIGEKLPSESVLHTEYDVSVITLRQALKHLESERLIEKHQGKGTFLRDTPKPFVEDLSLPGTKAKERDSINTSRIVEWRRDSSPSIYLKQAFHINSTEPMVFLRRLFYRKDRLLGLNDVWFPEKMVPSIMEEGLVNGSITTTLEQKYNYKIISIENFIESAKLDATEASLLESPYDSSVLRVFSAHRVQGGQIVEYSCTSWLGTLTRFHINVDI